VEVGLGLPSLQSQVRSAEYRVIVETDKNPDEVETAIKSLLSSDKLPWQHTRDKEVRQYDLRTLVEDIWIIECQPPEFTVGMKLRCDGSGTGRPEQVLSALGFTDYPKSIHRIKFILEKQAKPVTYR
jgi:hypothetical protein